MEEKDLLELWRNEGYKVRKHLGDRNIKTKVEVANKSNDWNDKVHLVIELYVDVQLPMPESSLEIVGKTELGKKLYYSFLTGLI